MDDDALNMRNWGYYEPTFKGHLGLQLMTSMAEQRDTKAFLPGRDPNTVMVGANGTYHHPRGDCVVSDAAPVPMNYGREWVSQREKLLNMLPANHYNNNNNVLPETSAAHPMQMMQPSDAAASRDDQQRVGNRVVEEPVAVSGGKETGPSKKRQAAAAGSGGGTPKAPKVKKPRKPKDNSNNNNNSNNSGANPSAPRLKAPKKSLEVVINGIDMDISGIPIPVCSCTGTPQQCYRWGCGGWQSACCTTNVSVYPLPMSTKRRGARIAGRKMSQGAFKKVLEKLAAEGYNFANPIDLRTHWARHGTNKFVTIR